MPKIYDNIENHLKGGLLTALESSYRADFCVGYFNLRGWRLIEEQLAANGCPLTPCRLLIGMVRQPEEQLRQAFGLDPDAYEMDQSRAICEKQKLALALRHLQLSRN